jgi:hypothetical protein
MKNPATVVPDAVKVQHALWPSAEKGGVPSRTLALAQQEAQDLPADDARS